MLQALLTRIGNFRNLGDKEQAGKNKDKDGNGSVHPLNIVQSLLVAEVGEEDV